MIPSHEDRRRAQRSLIHDSHLGITDHGYLLNLSMAKRERQWGVSDHHTRTFAGAVAITIAILGAVILISLQVGTPEIQGTTGEVGFGDQQWVFSSLVIDTQDVIAGRTL